MDNPHDFISNSTCHKISLPEKKTDSSVAEGHGQKILTVLQSFRAQNIFFDFKILVNDEVIPCHRCVLAACSDFFRYIYLYMLLCISIFLYFELKMQWLLVHSMQLQVGSQNSKANFVLFCSPKDKSGRVLWLYKSYWL